MPFKSSENVFSLKDYKAILDAEANNKRPYAETGHLHQGNNVLLTRPKWFKGSRDRGLRGNLRELNNERIASY